MQGTQKAVRGSSMLLLNILTILRYRLLVSLVPRRCVATPITAWFDCSTAANTPQIPAQFLIQRCFDGDDRDCRNKFTLRILDKPTIVSTRRVRVLTCLPKYGRYGPLLSASLPAGRTFSWQIHQGDILSSSCFSCLDYLQHPNDSNTSLSGQTPQSCFSLCFTSSW
jgi:hypothetical protein